MPLISTQSKLHHAAAGSAGLVNLLRVATLLALLGLITGCAAVYEPGITVQPPVRVLGATETLVEGATTSMPIPPEYRISPGDQLSIRFPRRPGYSDTFLVRADGRITAPLIGTVMAASRTPDELQASLSERYRQLITSLPPARQRSYRLQPDDVLDIRFSYFTTGNSVVVIRSDGRISLPVVGDVLAEGLTPIELQKELVQLFTNRIPNPDLVVMVKEARSNTFFYQGEARILPDPGLMELAVNITRTVSLVVYIGGEVPSPGVRPFFAGSSALQAIYSAGGPTLSGDMRSVVILRRGANDSVIRVVTDLTQDLSGTGTGDTVIQPFDVVLVPRSNIAKVGDAIDQYIYQIVRPLANSSIGFYFTKQVGTQKQDTTLKSGQ